MPEDANGLAAFEARDVEAVVQDEAKLAMSRYQRQASPRAILLAGQPGAGKTELSSMLSSEMAGDVAFINGDDYRRYHPHRRQLYQKFGADSVGMISPFSNSVTEQLIAALARHRLNLIIEGTGRTVEVPKVTAERLTAEGYAVEMAVIATRPEISLISTLLRFYQMEERGTIPRATAISAHDSIVAVLPGNLDMLVSLPCISRLSIWNRDLQRLFDSNIDTVLPSEVLTGYWESPWLPEEIQCAHMTLTACAKKSGTASLGRGARLMNLSGVLKPCSQRHRPLVWICYSRDPSRAIAGGIFCGFLYKVAQCHL